MENFKKTSSEIVNGNLVAVSGAKSRGLVLVNHGTGATYVVEAKCRQSTPLAIAKAVAKAMLAVEKERQAVNNTEAAKESKKRVISPLQQAMGGDTVYICDKAGNVIKDVCLTVEGKTDLDGRPLTLRKVFRFTKSQDLYKLVVINGREWNTPEVQSALNAWCTAAIEQMDWLEKADAAIGAAADSTEAEQKAAEKAAKTAKKDAEKAAKADIEAAA